MHPATFLISETDDLVMSNENLNDQVIIFPYAFSILLVMKPSVQLKKYFTLNVRKIKSLSCELWHGQFLSFLMFFLPIYRLPKKLTTPKQVAEGRFEKLGGTIILLEKKLQSANELLLLQ